MDPGAKGKTRQKSVKQVIKPRRREKGYTRRQAAIRHTKQEGSRLSKSKKTQEAVKEKARESLYRKVTRTIWQERDIGK